MCPWHCSVCKSCHVNACPRLWGGALSPAPCACDVRFLRPERRTIGHPETWAWDSHSELVALWCDSCAEVCDGYGDETSDGDTCQHCGSEHTRRAITNTAHYILRGA